MKRKKTEMTTKSRLKEETMDMGELFGMMGSLVVKPARQEAAKRMKAAFNEKNAKTPEEKMRVLKKLIKETNEEKERVDADKEFLGHVSCIMTTMYKALREKKEGRK